MTTFFRKSKNLSRWVMPLILALTIPLVQAAGNQQGGRPPKIDVASALSVDAKTAQAVEQVLEEQHAKHRALQGDREAMHAKHEALRTETDQKLAKYLTKEQIEKLHQLMPKPPRPEGQARDGSAPR